MTLLPSIRTESQAEPTPDAGPPPTSSGEHPTGTLLRKLAAALQESGIAYCQWKGHWSTHRWATGRGDVDLLVDHEAAIEVRQLLGQLGFKLALPAADRQIEGVELYLGHDPDVPRLLRLQVHYRLMLGEFWKPAYRIPLERSLLSAAVPGTPFRVPTPTHQFLVFVFRVMLRQVGRPLLSIQRRWLAGIQAPLESLESGCDWRELSRLFSQHLPSMSPFFFERCVRSLRAQSGWVERAILPWLLTRRLREHRRRPRISALFSAAVERFASEAVGRRLSDRRMRFAAGGTVVGLIGGSGTGKTSCARELSSWLEPVIPTLRARLAHPPRTLLTWLVDGASALYHTLMRWLKREVPSDGLLELLRTLCLARDRYRMYLQAHRFAASGGIALCEDYPMPQIRELIGPSLPSVLGPEPSPLRQTLQRMEAGYYDRIAAPDALCVLRLDPEFAVQRKSGALDDLVRTRARVIWEADWSRPGIHLIDAGRPLPAVLSELKRVLWDTV